MDSVTDSINKEVSPNDGGCWYCYREYEPMIFDTEFDTYLHKKCLIKALEEGSEEAQIMSYLLEE